MSAKQELAAMIAKFTPELAKRANAILKKVRTRVPGATELVYDNYNALAIAFSASDKPSEIVFSIALYPKWVSMFFMRARALPDPERMLKGSGKFIRHIVLDEPKKLDEPAVKAILKAALDRADPPFNPKAKSQIVIRSVSAKQRPRRPKAKP